jgi:hypothetical protein
MPEPTPSGFSRSVLFSPKSQVILTLTLALLILLFLQTSTVLKRYEGRPTSLFMIGERFYVQGPEEILGFKPYVHADSFGFDGQFFYFLAHDPFLRRGAYRFLDDPRLRAQRVGYPLLAWLLALGIKPLLPASLYLVNMLALLGSVALLGARARQAGRPYFYGLAFVLCASTITVATTMTCEVVTTFFLLLAFRFHEKQKTLPLLGATLMAVFCKEICLLWVAALMACALFEKRRDILIGCFGVVALWAGWQVYLAARIPAPYLARSTLQNFDWPFKGAVEQVVHLFREHKHVMKYHGYELGLMLTFFSMGGRGLLRLRGRGWRDPVTLLFAASGLCAFCLSRVCWDWLGNFARQLFILLAVALWTMPQSRPAQADTYGHVGLSLWYVYAKILRKVI